MNSHVLKLVYVLTLLTASLQSFGVDEGAKYPSNLMMFKCGEIKPLGWIHEQMNGDLTKGYIAHYDKISNQASQDIFVNNQGDYNQPVVLRPQTPVPPVPTWWCGEVEGGWMEAVAKQAFLTDNKHYQEVARG